MKYEETIGKTVALVMMGKDARGEDDWAVVKGVLERSGGDIVFIHDGKPDRFALPDDALARIKPTTPETRAILLDADLSLPLTIGPTPEGPEGRGLVDTGMKWPEESK